MEKLSRMYREKRQIGLLTWTYASVAVIVFVIAGVVALINQSAGVALLIVPLIAIARAERKI